MATVLLVSAASVQAGEAPAELDRRFELDKLADIHARASELPTDRLAERVDFQYGGWLRISGYSFRNSESDTHTAVECDLRLWGQLRVDDIHTFYVRPQSRYTRFLTGEDFDEEDAFEDLRLNVGFYDLDVAACMEGSFGSTPFDQLHLTLGRKFFSLGSGLLLARRADGVELRGRLNDLECLLLGAKTIHSDDDVDQSRPDSSESVREFLGAQVTCDRFPSFSPYVLLMRQRDHNDRRPESGAQLYLYDSDYFGLGVAADIGSKVQARVEWVRETGRSAAEGPSAGTEGIDASALVVRLDAPLGVGPRSRLFLQYLFGSGDKDRLNPTDTLGGNAPGTDDSSFVPFGFVDTGWALSPTLSNLHVFQLGAACKPLDNLELGSSLYVFRKEHRSGGISDPGGTGSGRHVGQEMDVLANWRITSDLAANAVVGYFWPGSAMQPRCNRPFVQLSLTYSF